MSQRVSILFYLKKSKQNKKGQVLIYTRIAIDGSRSEISIGLKQQQFIKRKSISLARKKRQCRGECENLFGIRKIFGSIL
jgi:hypothetical protein